MFESTLLILVGFEGGCENFNRTNKNTRKQHNNIALHVF